MRLVEWLSWIKGVRGLRRDVPFGLAWTRASVVLAKFAAREVFFSSVQLFSYVRKLLYSPAFRVALTRMRVPLLGLHAHVL